NGNVQLGRGQSARQGGIRVAVYQHAVGPVLEQNGLDALKLFPRHGPVAAAPHRQMVIGPRDLHFLEEDVGHGRVIVLAGVNEGLLQPGLGGEGPRHGGGLDELRPCPQDGGDLLHAAALLLQRRFSSRWRCSTCSYTWRWCACSSSVLCHSRVKVPPTRWQASIRRTMRACAAATSRGRRPPMMVDSITMSGRRRILSGSPMTGSMAEYSWQVPQRKPGCMA